MKRDLRGARYLTFTLPIVVALLLDGAYEVWAQANPLPNQGAAQANEPVKPNAADEAERKKTEAAYQLAQKERIAERERLLAQESGKAWITQFVKNRMDDSEMLVAKRASITTVEISGYGEQRAMMSIHFNSAEPSALHFGVKDGDFLCGGAPGKHSYHECMIAVRFDDRPAQIRRFRTPSDGSMTIIELDTGDTANVGVLNNLLPAEMLRIQPTIYRNGSPVLEFDLTGLADIQASEAARIAGKR